jgi:hypothetical protein
MDDTDITENMHKGIKNKLFLYKPTNNGAN